MLDLKIIETIKKMAKKKDYTYFGEGSLDATANYWSKYVSKDKVIEVLKEVEKPIISDPRISERNQNWSNALVGWSKCCPFISVGGGSVVAFPNGAFPKWEDWMCENYNYYKWDNKLFKNYDRAFWVCDNHISYQEFNSDSIIPEFTEESFCNYSGLKWNDIINFCKVASISEYHCECGQWQRIKLTRIGNNKFVDKTVYIGDGEYNPD